MGSERHGREKKRMAAMILETRICNWIFFFLRLLTIIAQGLHHDLRLCKLVGEADLAGHFAARVTVAVQLLAAAAVLHHAALALLVVCSL